MYERNTESRLPPRDRMSVIAEPYPCSTLILDPPPRSLPIFIGIERPFRCLLGSAWKTQSRSDPRLVGH